MAFLDNTGVARLWQHFRERLGNVQTDLQEQIDSIGYDTITIPTNASSSESEYYYLLKTITTNANGDVFSGLYYLSDVQNANCSGIFWTKIRTTSSNTVGHVKWLSLTQYELWRDRIILTQEDSTDGSGLVTFRLYMRQPVSQNTSLLHLTPINEMLSGASLVEETSEYATEFVGTQITISDAGSSLEANVPVVTAASEDGVAYTATVSTVRTLKAGARLIMVPAVVSTTTQPTLSVNGLTAKRIRRRLSRGDSSYVDGYNAAWLTANKPVPLYYDGSYWIAENLTKPDATDLSGTVSISKGGTGATDAETARTNLGAAAAEHTHSTLSKSSNNSGDMTLVFEDQSTVFGMDASGAYSSSDDTLVRLSLRVEKDTGLILARTDSKAGTKYPTLYTTINKPTCDAIGAATKVAYTATLLSSGWSSSAPYTQSVTVDGILATDAPVVDLNMSSATISNAESLQGAWANVGRIVTAANTITAYCYSAQPTFDIPLNIMVVR